MVEGREKRKYRSLGDVMALQKVVLRVSGMHCASCSVSIEKGLREMSGIIEAQINYASEQAAVEYDDQVVNQAAIIEKIVGLGYKAQVFKDMETSLEEVEKKQELANMRFQLIISMILAGLLIIGAMVILLK